MTRVVVTVMPKDGVLDPQGQAVERALRQLGFEEVDGVRIGKRIELDVPAADAEGTARRMCEQLLANPLIEDFTIAVDG
jgi:phosphoribosylformylglycinamidine synthase subunit PurS